MMRRSVSHRSPRAVAILVAAAVTVAACGTGADEPAAPQQFTYWSMWEENEPQAEVIKEAIDAFTKESGVQVKVEWQGRKVLQKLTPALRSGDVPDLVDQDGNSIRGAMVSNGQNRDMSAVMATQVPGEGKTVAEVGPGRYRDLITDAAGKPFLVPYEALGYGIFYNGAKHPELATTAPATWDDFIALLDRSKAKVALDGDIGSYAALWTVHALGAELGPGKVKELAADKTGQAWSAPQVRPALERIEKLAKGGYFAPGSFGSKFPAMQEKWAAGQADFLLMGSWAPSETQKSAPQGFQYRALPFPGAASVQAAVIGFAVPKRAAHPAAAERFIASFMKKERMQGLATVALNITTRPDVPAPEQLADIARQLTDKPVTPFYEGLDTLGTYPVEVFEPTHTEFLSGKITAAEFATEIGEKQAAFWKKNS
ncbi:MAG: extracellular solute-binding protein [Nonomuraea sp.]|nr:extracellular solute-binding protein [Nonomuraea sp.]NUP68714.1 extracellular solute-binding protein [Nonomuraea sp.]